MDISSSSPSSSSDDEGDEDVVDATLDRESCNVNANQIMDGVTPFLAAPNMRGNQQVDLPVSIHHRLHHHPAIANHQMHHVDGIIVAQAAKMTEAATMTTRATMKGRNGRHSRGKHQRSRQRQKQGDSLDEESQNEYHTKQKMMRPKKKCQSGKHNRPRSRNGKKIDE